MNHLTRILEDMTNVIERLGMRWKEKSLTIVAGRSRSANLGNSTQWKRPLPGRPNYWERPFTRFLGDARIPKLKACNTWIEWLSLTKGFEHSWHAMLNLKQPESSCACDVPVERSKKIT